MNRQLIKIIIMFLGIMLNTTVLWAEDSIQVNVSPVMVDIDAFYTGVLVSITGTISPDCEAVIRIVGEFKDARMKEKDRVFGILWMNRNTYVFESVPNVFFLCTTKEIQDILNAEKKDAPIIKLGLSSLENQITIEPGVKDKSKLIKEFVKLKKNEGLYAVMDNVSYMMSQGLKKFKAEFKTPSKLPPGKYRVEAYAVRNGQIISKGDSFFEAKLAGFPALLSKLAFHYGAVYGVLATLIALITGLVIGLVFGGGKGAH